MRKDQLTKHLSVPVTGKIRPGWDGNENYLEIARVLEDNGAALVANNRPHPPASFSQIY